MSVTIGGESSYLFPAESTGEDHYSSFSSGEAHSSAEGGSADGEEGHHITDFGIGTLVLAMTLGAASRTYLTHVTG